MSHSPGTADLLKLASDETRLQQLERCDVR